MKTKILSILLCLFSLQFAQAQDLITKRTGEKVEAKVLEISTLEVKYKLFSNMEGPTYVVPKSEIMLIQYPDNTSETFELTEAAPVVALASADAEAPAASKATALQLYNQGQTDAITYYDGYKSAGTAVLITSLLSPVLGLAPAIGTSVTTPKQQNLDAPDNSLLQQPDYASGYRKKARKIKAGKVWTNWAIGLGTNVALILLLSNS
ncbi:hypothetical protein [Pontibacter pamirensis]|uniref:hypothetical protein n=1 Tax=Pontibacter pamirensis TaxID=2562824 RepID=UPI0013894618|nr:hypothetical protein [Pontibacter pamirensis]